MFREARHICVICRHLSYKCMSVNGGRWFCHDGCYSTTGIDRRTVDGLPGWEHGWKNKKKDYQ